MGASIVEGFGSRPRPGLPVPRIVFAGRMARDKGPDLLLGALARMAARRPRTCVGSGALAPALRGAPSRSGSASASTSPAGSGGPGPGWRARRCSSSRRARRPGRRARSLAMGLGVPVVAFAVEGLPAVVGEGRGILVPPGDAEALARAVDDVLSGRRRPDLDAARRFAAGFTRASVTPRYAAAYAELAARRRPPVVAPLAS